MTAQQTAVERIVDALRGRGSTVIENGSKATAQCPVPGHGQGRGDLNPSLSIGPREDGKGAVIKCFAGCDNDAVVAALGLTLGDLFDERKLRAAWRASADYRYPGGRVNKRVALPGGGKNFYQTGGGNRDKTLYLGDQLGDPDQVVYVNEGEKAADTMRAAYGVIAIATGGATRQVDFTPLAGRNVVLIADNDDAGRKWLAHHITPLASLAASVRTVRAAVDTDKADAADHIAAGYTLDDFIDMPSPAPDELDYDEPPPDDDEPASIADVLVDGFEPISGFPYELYGLPAENPPPSAPADVARLFCQRDFRLRLPADEQTATIEDADGSWWRRGPKTLAAWRGGWMMWRTTHWDELDLLQLRAHIYRTLRNAHYLAPAKDGSFEERPWKPDRTKVTNVIDAMQAYLHLPSDIDPPTWIAPPYDTNDDTVISCANGLLSLTTRTLSQHTPGLFNLVSVPFDYQQDPGEPKALLALLRSQWSDDQASIMLLQEYMGYLVSGRTDLQKLLLLLGPTRSGKGTLGRLLRKLLGAGNVTGPTLASLGTNFGLSPLLNRPLAIVSDARLGRDTNLIVERLLSITGEDTITVDRKYRETWTGKLPTRFVILTNEIPKFCDASGAIANRMLVLQMTESFLGREDYDLDAKLAADLPAILNWALEGLDRLNRNGGRFTVPKSSRDAVTLMIDLASPVSAFIRERCIRGPQESVPRDDLFDARKLYAENKNLRAGANSTFGRDLRAAAPDIRDRAPRKDGLKDRRYAGIRLRTVEDDADDEAPVGQVGQAGKTVGQDKFDLELTKSAGQEGSGTGGTGGTGRNSDTRDRESGRTEYITDNGSLRVPPVPTAVQGMFGGNGLPVPANGEARCRCGNPLLTSGAVKTGRCKPCRDKQFAGYDT